MGTFIDIGDVPGIPVNKAEELIAELEGYLRLHFPCITPSLQPADLDTLRALLVAVVRRWSDVGTGITTSEGVGPMTRSKSNGGGHVLWTHEHTSLRLLCQSTPLTPLPAGSFPPAEPIGDLFVRRPTWL